MFEASEVIREIQELREEGFLSDALLRRAVRRIHAADDRFDWVGVYLLNEAGDELWLHNYVGSPTEHSRIAVGAGVCGTAVAEGANQIVGDVTAIDNYIACDPHVRSEIVVLIRCGEQIFGQIDIDSREPDAFTEDDERELQAIADVLGDQIALERV
ncbi:MAG: GAF domain-containing protein [Gemmatimonadetes bacterium]|nr:MAG: GAF domain-containing protein [Gemmatimonadota bacterium]